MQAPDITKQPTLYVVPYAHLDTQWRWEFPQVISEYMPETSAWRRARRRTKCRQHLRGLNCEARQPSRPAALAPVLVRVETPRRGSRRCRRGTDCRPFHLARRGQPAHRGELCECARSRAERRTPCRVHSWHRSLSVRRLAASIDSRHLRRSRLVLPGRAHRRGSGPEPLGARRLVVPPDGSRSCGGSRLGLWGNPRRDRRGCRGPRRDSLCPQGSQRRMTARRPASGTPIPAGRAAPPGA